MTPRARLGRLQAGLLMLGLLLIALWSRDNLAARAFQLAGTKELEAAAREAAAATPSDAAFAGPRAARSARRAAEGRGVLGRIGIPRLRITAIVAEGTDVNTLKHAVGHVESTALPGGPGNVALAGHRDSFFRGLGDVRKGDLIRLETRRATYTYKVEWTEIVEPRRVDVLDATDTPSLTLITCYPFRWIGHAPKRFVVRARQIESRAEEPRHHDAPATTSADQRRHDKHT